MELKGQNEELKKFSKGNYCKESFISEFKKVWEPTDLQIRFMYLAADLAVNSQGVFSVSHEGFLEMFKNRFEMSTSLSSVRRFFKLLKDLGLIEVRHAKRKNNKQTSNIYIVEPISEEVHQEYDNEYGVEHPLEQVSEQAIGQAGEHQIITLNNTLNKTLNNVLSIDNYQATENNNLDKSQFKTIMRNACDEFYTKFAPARYTKKSWFTLTNKFIKETIESGRYKNIPHHKVKGYCYKSLEKMADHTDYKNSEEYAEYQESMRALFGQEVVQ